jgi:hypothetical protein
MKYNIFSAALVILLAVTASALSFEEYADILTVENYKRERGKPVLHDNHHHLMTAKGNIAQLTPPSPPNQSSNCYNSYIPIGCNDNKGDPECKKLKLMNSHQGRAVTNTPIYGILTQPFRQANSSADEALRHFNSSIAASHVKFLQSAGARVVPIDYRLKKAELYDLLIQLNGVYITSDSLESLQNKQYNDTIFSILEWTTAFNEEEDNHFPLVATSFGYLALVKALLRNRRGTLNMTADLIDTSLEINLN